MAKTDSVGVIEKHIEKMVLALCLLLLVYGGFRWVAASPRTVDIPRGGKVSPDQIDAEILRRAELAQEKNGNAIPPIYKPTETMTDIEILRKGPTVRPGPHYVLGTTPLKMGVGAAPPDPIKITVDRLAQLLPAPSQPSVKSVTELPQVSDAQQAGDRDVARPMCTWDRNKANEGWKEELKKKIDFEIIVVAVEVEKMTKQPGASWRDATIETVKQERIPIWIVQDRKEIQLAGIPVIPPYTGENVRAVRDVIAQLASLQEDILQPKYWPIWDQSSQQWDDWRKNLPQDPLAEIDAPLIESKRSKRRFGGITAPSRRGSARGRTTNVDGRREIREMAPDMGGPEGPEGPDGPGGPGGGSRRPARRAGSSRAKASRERAVRDRKRQADEKRRQEVEAKRLAAEIAEERAVQVRQVPAFQVQLIDGKVLVWAHDTSVEPGVTYRYRIRLKVLNPLFTHERDMDESFVDHAREPVVPTPWSPWSDPAQAPHATELFLTGLMPSAKGGGQVRVTVFTRSMGQRVKEDFFLFRGQAIGGIRSKVVVNQTFQAVRPRGAEQEDRLITKSVDFSTGAVVVAIDFKKKILRNRILRKTTEMKYLDTDGILRRCIFVTHLPADSSVRERYELLKEEAAKLDEAIQLVRTE